MKAAGWIAVAVMVVGLAAGPARADSVDVGSGRFVRAVEAPAPADSGTTGVRTDAITGASSEAYVDPYSQAAAASPRETTTALLAETTATAARETSAAAIAATVVEPSAPGEWSWQRIVLLVLLAGLGVGMWIGYARIEPDLWRKLKEWEETRIPTVAYGDLVFVKASSLVRTLMVALRGLRLVLGLVIVYFLAADILPSVGVLSIRLGTVRGFLYSIGAIALFRVVNATFPRIYSKLEEWEGGIIVPFRLFGRELVGAHAATEITVDAFRLARLVGIVAFTGWLFEFYVRLFSVPLLWTGVLVANAILAKLLGAVLLAAVFGGFHKYLPKIAVTVDGWEGDLIRHVSIRGYEIFSAETVTDGIISLIRFTHLMTAAFFLYILALHFGELLPAGPEAAVRSVALGLFWAVGFTLMMILVARALWGVQRIAEIRVQQWKGTLIQSIRVKRAELFAPERLAEIINLAVKLITRSTIVVAIYFYITSVFALFTFSQAWADKLVGYVLSPATAAVMAVVNYLPNLFTVIVIILVAYYLVRLVRWFFLEVEKGTIPLPGFYNDWAMPTYKIVRFLAIAFVLVVVFPYLPGSDSPAFQGVSIFIGVLFSLGSSSAIANVVAGVVLTYMRALEPGDRVKIGETTGDVIEKTLLVTRVRTPKNVEISIPNAMVLGNHIINYSASARDGGGLLLHTAVTIGYDVPWRQVHELLIESARRTENLLAEPAPFVLQTGLSDFYPEYELNAYTNEPNKMAKTYSDLHANIQDVFNDAGVEILSPHYSAMRDGNETTIPASYRADDYAPPPFRLLGLGGLFGGTKPSPPPDADSDNKGA